jgi:hypothetical protein
LTWKQEWGLGAGTTFKLPGNIPVFTWVNIRTDGIPNSSFSNGKLSSNSSDFNGIVSGNMGVAISLDQIAAFGLQKAGLAYGSRAIPLLADPATEPEGASMIANAGGMLAGSGALRAAGLVASEYAGVGYRVEVHFEGGEPVSIYYHGRQIADLRKGFADVQNFVEEVVAPLLAPSDENSVVKLGMKPEAAHILARYFKSPRKPEDFLDQTAAYLNASARYTHVPLTRADIVKWFNNLPLDRLNDFVARQMGHILLLNGQYSTVPTHEPLGVAFSIPDMVEAAEKEDGFHLPKPWPATVGPPVAPPEQLYAVKTLRGAQIRRGPGVNYPPAGPPLPYGHLFMWNGVEAPDGRYKWYQDDAGRWVRADLLAKQDHGALNALGGRYDKGLEAKVSPVGFSKVTVGPGDSFWKILQRNGLQSRAQEITDLNKHIPDMKFLNPDDVIYLPPKDTAK